MDRFYEMYLKIINEQARPEGMELHEFDESLQLIYPVNEWFLDLHKIIDETIKAVELTPVPDDILIECYRNLKLISDSCFKISYARIIEIVEKSSYELSDVFIECLKKYANDPTGNLYIFKGKIDDIESSFNNIYETNLFKRIRTVIDDEDRIFEFIAALQNMRKSDGLTIIKRDINFEKYKDCFIYISSANNFKDILEHEFTHFIQRVCKFDKNLPKIYDHSLKKENSKGFIKAIDEVTAEMDISGWDKLSLIQFLNDKLQLTEQHQTIKSMIKFFIRRYEKDSRRFEVNHKMLKISQIENTSDNIRIRLEWLDELLHKDRFLDLEDYLKI